MHKVEKTWMTKAGLRACCLMVENSHRCGYVAISPSHPLYARHYSDECDCLREPAKKLEDQPIGKRGIIPVFLAASKGEISPTPDVVFDVHGGITFSNGDGRYPIPGTDLWWFGFDCAHHGDKTAYLPFGEERTLDYVVQECENLAAQLAEIEKI